TVGAKLMSSARIRNSSCFVFAIAITISLAAAVEGQDRTLEDLERLGREASRIGNYGEAVRYFRLAVERAERAKASDTDLVVSLGNLAEGLRSTGQYDDAERLSDRALRILRTSSTVDTRHTPVILT